MVAGRVVAQQSALKPTVELLVYGQSRNRARVQAVVDTGFTEQFTLLAHAISTLNLVFAYEEKLTMANGETITFDVYYASLEWDGKMREVKIHLADGDPLIGMAMLRDHDIHIRATPDGPVSIQPLN